jgi:hypothetical protein
MSAIVAYCLLARIAKSGCRQIFGVRLMHVMTSPDAVKHTVKSTETPTI